MNKRKNKQNMENIYTNMWESQISKTRKLKQTICQCCLNLYLTQKQVVDEVIDIKFFSQITCDLSRILSWSLVLQICKKNSVWDKYWLSSMFSDLH